MPLSPLEAARSTQTAARFLEQEVFPLIKAPAPDDTWGWCLWGYFQRLLPIVRSQALLTQGSFFQTTISASRTLLEILVDVALLVHRSPPDAAQRILAWEDSAKLVAAEQCVSYLDRIWGRESPLYRTMTTWIEARGSAIREERVLYWPPRGRHPSRWTDGSLLDDCRAVDKLAAARRLEQLYETEYRQMNWSIHGSGFASVRGLDAEGIDLTFSLSHLRISYLALMATGMIAEALGLHQDVSERTYQLAEALANRFRKA